MIEIDGFDTKILASLQDDAAVTNQQLGERIGLSASQVSRRRQPLFGDGSGECQIARVGPGGGRLVTTRLTIIHNLYRVVHPEGL